jgi:hypothetical protein
MSEHSYSRRKLLAGMTAATIGGIGLSKYSGSAKAKLDVNQTYNLEDQTTEITNELEDVRLVVTAQIDYQADAEVTQLIAKLEAAESGTDMVELDVSVIQQNTKENSTEITLRGSLAEIIDIQRLVDNTIELDSKLTVILEASGEQIAEEILTDSGSLTIENGQIQTDLGIQATGSYEVSES